MKDIEEFGRNRLLPVSAAFHQFPAMEVATNDATVLGPFYLSVVYGTMVAVTSVHQGEKRRGPAPTAFVPKAWGRQLKTDDGAFDLTGYRLCTLDRLRRAIRRRDVFPVRSLRYADPRKGLLTGAAWDAARPTVCRTVGVAVAGDEEIAKLSARIDLAYRETAARVPDNDAVTITKTASGADLSIGPLDRIDEPLSLIELHKAIDARLRLYHPRHGGARRASAAPRSQRHGHRRCLRPRPM